MILFHIPRFCKLFHFVIHYFVDRYNCISFFLFLLLFKLMLFDLLSHFHVAFLRNLIFDFIKWLVCFQFTHFISVFLLSNFVVRPLLSRPVIKSILTIAKHSLCQTTLAYTHTFVFLKDVIERFHCWFQ